MPIQFAVGTAVGQLILNEKGYLFGQRDTVLHSNEGPVVRIVSCSCFVFFLRLCCHHIVISSEEVTPFFLSGRCTVARLCGGLGKRYWSAHS